jgi:hypothetical protein
VAEDNCEVEVTQTGRSCALDSILAVGRYEIEYTCSGCSRQQSVTCTFFIDVIDTEEPAIVCPGNDLVSGNRRRSVFTGPHLREA